jgi:UMF1 family MFS transporter
LTVASAGSFAALAPAQRRGLVAWCLYDWANSAFPTIISTFVFATYFVEAVAPDIATGTAQWSLSMSVAGLGVALLAPVLGAIADRGGRRKPLLALATMLCVPCCALLWFVKPDAAFVPLAVVLVCLGTIAFEIGTVFYNALLPLVAPPAILGRVSGIAWGVGYAGGLAALVVALLVLVQPNPSPFGFDRSQAEHVRAVGPLVALWWCLFAWPIFAFVREDRTSGLPWGRAAREGLAAMARVLPALRGVPGSARFLLGNMMYMNGLNTLFSFGAVYAAGTFGMKTEEVLQFGIALNVTAGAGAVGFSYMDDKVGSKPTILVSLAALMGLGVALLLAQQKSTFWALGLAMGVFMGPVQAASRTLIARLAPPSVRAEFFGLFALSGRVTSFAGPAVLGWATLVWGSQRVGMGTILGFLLAGFVLLAGVRAPRPQGDTP